ncbi:MAG TPA: molybdenum cofactor guanylyltransferase [Candidatus Dormibacteraeota bacterium]|nr:molybdenum cofactor guanylyltransferase [Candidatus Dormibacteraeota bacterium]
MPPDSATNKSQPSTSTAGYVMAGGASTRFGEDKARAILAGQPMLTRMCDLLSTVATSVQIVAPANRYEFATQPIIEDRWPGEGPLGGIITALLHSRALVGARHAVPAAAENWNLIVSCDMPFLTAEFLAYLRDFAEASHAKAVVPESAHGREPLCACWRTSAATELQIAFEAGMRRVNDALKLLNAEVLDEQHWKRFDSAGRLFWNMNTPADYAEAQRIVASEPK